MAHYIGVDIVEIGRIRKAIARWGNNFLSRVYTERELELYGKKVPSLAARFAGKEAVIKALCQPGGIYLNQIEILSDPDGRPLVNLYGRAEAQARKLGLRRLAVSLSHSKEYAIAFVSGEEK